MILLRRKLDVVVTKQNTNGKSNAHAKSHTHLQFAPANAPPKIAKEYVFAHADGQNEKKYENTIE